MSRADVLVVHPPVSVASDFIDYPYFTDLGALQLAAVLERRVPTRLLDAFAVPGAGVAWRGERLRLGLDADRFRERLEAELQEAEIQGAAVDFVVVAYTPFHRPPTRDDLLASCLAGLRRRLPEAVLLLADAYQSGQHYVEVPGAEVLASYPEADAWVKYEAEVTVPALVDAWRERGRRPQGVVAGVAPADLDALPFPAWERVDLAAYDRFRTELVARLGRGRWAFPIEGRTLPLVTSRGCPFTCVHCSSNPDAPAGRAKAQRRYSPARLGEYLEHLAGLGAGQLAVLDEMLNVSTAHFDRFLAAAAELDLRCEIPNGLRADFLERRHLEALKERITTLSVSAESGVQRVVDEVVEKRLDLGRVVEVAETANEVGLPLMIHYMIGLPGETAEEINGTLAFALDLWDRFRAYPAVQYATPLPGTALAGARKLPAIDDWGPYFQQAPDGRLAPTRGPVEQGDLERFMWAFDQRLSASEEPRKLVMNVTYVCNNHCTFCAVATRTQVDGNPVIQKRQLRQYREAGVELVDFDGGEPTMNPQLVPLIREAKALGYRRINVTTNGRLCVYDQYAARLVRSGLTSLLFSIHGADAETHGQQVGVAEAFEQTVQGVRNCVRLAPRGVELGMNVTITRYNFDQLEELSQLAWDLGLPWINLQFLTPFGRATRYVAPDTAVAARHAARLIDRWHDRMKIQVINLPFCFMPGYEEYIQGDVGKLERHMIFVNNEVVNLAAYLAERRVRKPQCDACPYACLCSGFYELEEVPEPPWRVTEADLERSFDPAVIGALRPSRS